jgi:hypothetical protein
LPTTIPGEVVPADRDVDDRLDPGGVERLDLPAQEVEPETGMLRAHLRRVVAEAVVAPGEDVDGLHVRRAHRFRERPRIEPRRDRRNLPGGMEVEVDLSERKA